MFCLARRDYMIFNINQETKVKKKVRPKVDNSLISEKLIKEWLIIYIIKQTGIILST